MLIVAIFLPITDIVTYNRVDFTDYLNSQSSGDYGLFADLPHERPPTFTTNAPELDIHDEHNRFSGVDPSELIILPFPHNADVNSERRTFPEPGPPTLRVPMYSEPPEVLERQIPEGGIDFVRIARRLIDHDRMSIYIGVVDLLDPNGYRYIEDSGIVHPASLIKSWIMEYAYLQVYMGYATLDDNIFGMSLEQRINFMMKDSCNNSTGLIIRHFGRANIDAWLTKGHSYTRLNSDFRGYNAGGRVNSSTVAEIIDFLERLFYNRYNEPYSSMLQIMLNSRTRDRLPESVAGFENVAVATKTGAFIHDRRATDHDMGIIISYDEHGEIKFAYAIVMLTFSRPGMVVSVARPTLIKVARDIFVQKNLFYEMTQTLPGS